MPATRMQPAVELGGDMEQLVEQRFHPLLGSTGAEELRSQGDAVERALPLERHPGAEQRLDGRPRRAPRLAGDEQDARDLDVRQLRQLPRHVRHDAPAEERRVGPCRSSCAHGWGPLRARTLSRRWQNRPVDRNYWVRTEHGRIWGPFTISALERLRGQLTENCEASIDGKEWLPGA